MLGSVQSVKISIFVARIIATQNTLRHQEEPAAILGTTAFSCLLLYEVILGLWQILQILSTLCFNRKTQCMCQLYCCHLQFLFFFFHPVLLSLGFFFSQLFTSSFSNSLEQERCVDGAGLRLKEKNWEVEKEKGVKIQNRKIDHFTYDFLCFSPQMALNRSG